MTTLKNICRKITDGSHNPPAGISRSNYFMISSKNIENDLITFENPRFLSKNDFINENKRTNIEINDVLITIVGAIGRVAVVTNDKIPFCVQRSVAVLKIDTTKAIPRFVMYYLQSKTSFFEKESRGVAQKGIYLKQIENFPFLPLPLCKQKKIVDVLDKIHLIINYRKQQLSKLDQLVKSRFVEMFGDLKSNQKKWHIASFNDFAVIDTSMTTDFKKYANYPHIGIDCIEKNTGEIKNYRTVKNDNIISGKYIFTKQHIIYSKIRPNLNKVALPTFNGLCSADAYPILPISEKCSRFFLAYVMRSEFFLEYILQFSTRTNLPKVNKKELQGFCMPLPPLSLQEQFADFVQQVDKAKLSIKQSLEKLETLKKSLMQEYFG